MTGSQEPRIKIEPVRVSSDGPDAAMLMDAYGYDLDKWQRDILDCWLGKDDAGDYIVTSAGLTVPRQNGKNVILEAREFFGMVVSGEKILHTAHQVKTSKKSFRRLVQMFTDKRHPEIMGLVKHIRYTNGEEAIELQNGGGIEFSARSRQAARGFDGISLVVYDEAQELMDDQVEAIMATLSASATGTRQIIYTGTPPYPTCPGEVFKRRREVCLTAPGPHDAWHEWSVVADGIDKINIGDRSLWYMTNPALGLRLSEDFTSEEFRTMSADGFARERLGWWMPAPREKQAELAIHPELWQSCESKDPKPEGMTSYGVKFTSDGSEVVLCGAVVPKDGPARITMLERSSTGAGLQWLADWLNARYKQASCVIIDGRNGADILIDKLQSTWKAKGSVIRPKASDIVTADNALINELTEKTVTWFYKQTQLSDSALGATKRTIYGGLAFGGPDAAPIEAAALALWAARKTKRNPAKKMRIG